jgi:hypothetical protein
MSIEIAPTTFFPLVTTFLILLPMQYPMAVGTQGYALGLSLAYGFGYVVFDSRQFVYRLLVLADDVVKIDDRRMAEPAVRTLLLGFVLLPLLALGSFT